MKKYWLMLEAYVFIWKRKSGILIYNTLSGKGYTYKSTPKIDAIISELQDKRNLYCTTINSFDLENPDVSRFIQSLRDTFSGNIINCSLFPQKPVVFIPESNIGDQLSRELELSYNPHIFGENILKNLTDLTIKLTGECNHDCRYCKDLAKQTLFCRKSEGILSIEKIESIFRQLSHSSIFDINFIGGNILSYPYWFDLMEIIKEHSCNFNFYINYLDFYNPELKKKLPFLKQKNCHLKILVDCHEIKIDDFTIIDIFSDLNVEYMLIVSDRINYEKCLSISENNGIRSQIIPFFLNDNLDFFRDFVYLNNDDILSTPWKKNQIFANQEVNVTDFGKLFIDSTGYIYSNLNFPPAGNLNDEIKEIIYNQMNGEGSWLRTRSQQKPCNECLYCDICPPLSNYEIAIGKANLCHINEM